MQAVAQIHRERSLQTTVKDIFEYRTAKELITTFLYDEHGNNFRAYDTEQGIVIGEAPILPI